MRIDALLNEAKVAERVEPDLRRLKKAAEGIESMFFRDLLQAMRRSVPESEEENSFGGQVYRDLFDQAVSEALGRSGSLGIAKVVYDSLAGSVAAQAKARALREAAADDPASGKS
ncbi:MAG: rod-binding protein [Armatimonadetes bacterium]|jgi:Rod binding domain-containing protein|nr:rod-binding protein [Armatimonadota bacterium]MCA1996128.1 rod-binding protein [Armatimonadota bacterium]